MAVNWSGSGGTIDAAGLYSANSTEGAFDVSASSLDGRITSTTGLTISTAAPSIDYVVLSPDSQKVLRSAVTQFQAYAHFSDGSFAPVDANYSTTSGSITSSGRLTAGTVPGTYSVIAAAKYGGKADTAALVVSNSGLIGLTLSPPSVALQSGSTQQFTATGILPDGTAAPVSVTYTARGGTITPGGLYTAGQMPGVFDVIALNEGSQVADTAVVAVSGPSVMLASIVLTPASASLLPGGQMTFTAVGLLTDGTSAPVLVNWAATGGAVTPAGMYTAPQVSGTYSVIARSQDGTKADTALVTVNVASQLTAVDLSPASSQIVTGALQQYTAAGILSDGRRTSIAVQYTATGGTITSGGLFSAGNAPGSYRVIAKETASGLADTAVVDVINLPPSGSTACSHEPSGYAKIFDQPFNSRPPDAPSTDGYGWSVRGSDGFRVTSDSDPGAPKSPQKILRGWFQAGGNGGSAPFRAAADFPRNYKAVFVCLFTKLDPAYTNNGNTGTKFGFLLTPYRGGSQGLNHYFNLTNNLGINLQSSGGVLNRNMQSSFNLVNHRGSWHKLEFLVVANALGASDGIARMWVDDAKVLDVNNVQYFYPAQTGAFNAITWNPTYGGGSNPIPYNMYQWVDNWYVSGN